MVVLAGGGSANSVFATRFSGTTVESVVNPRQVGAVLEATGRRIYPIPRDPKELLIRLGCIYSLPPVSLRCSPGNRILSVARSVQADPDN